MRVRAKLEFQLWIHDKELEPGPIAKKDQVMTVVGIAKRKVGRKKLDYLVVEVGGQRYDAWPPHCELLRG